MKQLVLLAWMFCALTLTAAVVQPGSPISRYPNTPTFHPSDLMILAVTNISPPTNKNMKMGDLALQIINSNKVVVLSGTNTLVVNTFTNGTNFYEVNSTAAGGAVGVGLAPGTTTIVVDGSVSGINNRTSVLTSDVSVLFENLITGVPIRWWAFSSNGAWNVTASQSHDSNTVSRGIEQPFTNNWVWVEALKISTAWTNFDSKAPPFTIGPGTNMVFDTNLATRHISVSAAGASGGGGDQVWTNNNGVIQTLAYGTNAMFSPGVANGATAIAYSLDTTNLLTDSSATLLSLRNKGTNRFKVFSDGETWIGKDLENWFSPAGPYRLVVGRSLETDPGAQSVYFNSFHPTSGLDWGFGLDTDTNLVQLTLTAGALIPTRLIPTIADGVTPYLFNTTLAHTTGNLAEFGNVSLNHFAVVATNGIVTPRISAYGATSQPWQFGSVVGDSAQVTINGVLVNLATGAGGVPSGYQTNQFTTNVAGTPVLGSLWLQGNVGTDVTNGARTGLEYIPSRNSFRVGGLGAAAADYWNSTNVGVGSFAHGTNVLAMGPYSTVHGMANLIRTNSMGSSISGGSNNIIATNVFYSVIGGGSINTIGDNHLNGVIGGGSGHIVDGGAPGSVSGGAIAGGFQNRVRLQYGFVGGGSGNDAQTTGGTIAGGINNFARSGEYQAITGGEANAAEGDWSGVLSGKNNETAAASTGNDGLASVIAGGTYNTIGSIAGNSGANYSAIVGGRTNLIPDLSAYGFIGGGSLNQVGGGGNAVNGNAIVGGFNNITDDLIDFAFIGGGIKNLVGGDFGSILGGVSNRTTAAYASVIGNFVTNASPKSVEIGVTNNNKIRVSETNLHLIGDLKLIMADGAVNGHVLTSDGNGVGTWVASGGAGAGGTNFDSIIVTNQVRYIAREFSGSNGTSGINLTNNFDASRATFNRTTNVIGTNLVYHLSNLVAGSSFIHNMYGGPSAKTVSYRIAGGGTGTNIFWYSKTNGNYDFQANPSIAYTVAGFIDDQTNVLMNLNATETLPFDFLIGTSLVSSNVTATNLTSVTAAFVNAGISNLLATNINGQLLSFSNGFIKNLTNDTVAIQAGESTTFAKVGGTISVNTTPVVSAGSVETNLITYSVPANILTNNNDRLKFRASGRFAATANAKQIKAIWGSQTILDTGSQVNNGGAWTVEGEIIRTGNTAQFASAEIHGLTNELYATAGAVTLAQTNGIITVLKLTSTAAGDGDVTNRTLVVEWSPAP